jgi:hypothetical protein
MLRAKRAPLALTTVLVLAAGAGGVASGSAAPEAPVATAANVKLAVAVCVRKSAFKQVNTVKAAARARRDGALRRPRPAGAAAAVAGR